MTWPVSKTDISARIRSYAWVMTPLGPTDAWPTSLRCTVDLILAHPLPMLLLWGPDGTILYNDAYAQTCAARDLAALGHGARDIWPERWQREQMARSQALAGEPVRTDAATYSPVHGDDGKVAGILVTILDSARRQTDVQRDAILRESEERYRTLATLVPALVWQADATGADSSFNSRWLHYTGQGVAATRDGGWIDAIHPDDTAATTHAFAEGLATHQPIELQHRLRRHDGIYRWFLTRQFPLHAADGTVRGWVGAATDIDDLRELQGRQHVLTAELQHRVRNILTVVRSVLNRTAERGGNLKDVLDHFRGRLDALARTQVIVSQTITGAVDLESLIRDELLSVGVRGDAPVLVEGPDVALPSKTAESIGLAIHELTTNALKYGALKVGGGGLDIRWTANMDDGGAKLLDLTWVEQGVPAVPVPPSRAGFGRELIEDALPYRLGATTELEFRGGGVRCRIVVPLTPADGERRVATG